MSEKEGKSELVQAYTGEALAGSMYSGMPESDYHGHKGSISKSGLDLVSKSPAHYRYPAPRDPTPAMHIGAAIHCAILEPDRFDSEWQIIDCPDKRAKAWKDAVAAFGADQCLTTKEAESVRAMQRAVRDSAATRGMSSGLTHAELSAFATDPETGVMVRCRYDGIKPGALVDLKSTRDARADEFSRSVWSYRYHVQAALYSDIWQWLYGETAPPFWFVVVEGTAPHTTCCYTLDDDAMAQGRREYRRDLNVYAECLASDCWPKYEPDSPVIGLPGYAMRQIEDELEVML